MDFGIAKMTTSTRLTATGQTMGTVRYMSPEQVRGQEVDLRTDIYSLGATLYESLVGDTPFDGNTHFEIMTKHLSETPRRPSKRGAEMPIVVEEAMMRSLAKRPEDRFASAREMRKLLEGALKDSDLGLVETQRLGRELLGELRPTTPPSEQGGPSRSDARGRAASTAGPLADELEPGTASRRRRSRLPYVALAAAVLVGGGVTAAVVARRAHRAAGGGGAASSVAIDGVALTRQLQVGRLAVETDGAVEPDEVAQRYTATLTAIRVFVKASPLAKVDVPDPIDVLLAVPAAALCEPSAYLDHQPPRNCATALSATAIGARGTHRLMIVSDGARLNASLRGGVAQAVCEFSPVQDDKLVRQLCDLTSRFAESPN
jgi:hypothetical protein